MSFPSYRCFYVKFPQADKRQYVCLISTAQPFMWNGNKHRKARGKFCILMYSNYIYCTVQIPSITKSILLRRNPNSKANLQAQKRFLLEILLVLIILAKNKKKKNPEWPYRLSADPYFTDLIQQQPPTHEYRFLPLTAMNLIMLVLSRYRSWNMFLIRNLLKTEW